MIKKSFYTILAVFSLAGIACAAEDPLPQAPKFTPGMAGSYLSGQFARSRGDIDGAIRYLKRVHRDDPTDPDLSDQLLGMMLVQGRLDEAMKLAEEIRRGNASDPLAGLLLSLHEIHANNLDRADTLLQAAGKGGNVQLWHPLLSAWLDLGRHRLDKPLLFSNIAAGTAGSRAAPLISYHLALINSLAGFTDEAARDFKVAITDPANPPQRAMQMLLQFYNEHGSPPSLAPLVQAYRDAHPDEKQEAAPVVANMQDGVTEVLYTMGGIMLASGISSDATVYLQLALYIKPGFAEAAMALGDAYGELQRYAKANEAYGMVPAGHPLYGKAQLHIAVNLDRMGKLSDALSLLDRRRRQAPADSDALVTKGDLLRIHSRFVEAADAYSQAIRRIPHLEEAHWPLLFARGACLERQGKWTDAEKELRRSLDLKPDQPDVLNYLGYGMLEHGENVTEARGMIEKAVKARPDDAQIVDSMGWALYLTGNYGEAVTYMEKAVELLPGDPTVNDHLGDVYWRLRRHTEARYQWERALTFSPEPGMADSLRQKLKGGLPAARLAKMAPGAGPSASAVTP